MPPSSSVSTPARWFGRDAWLSLGVLAVAAALVHSIAPAITDQDTSYHIAVARLMTQHGVLHAFPWTKFSWLAEHYVDKEFLFHVLMMPLAGGDPLLCARVVGSVLGFVVLATMFSILQREGAGQPLLWVLLGLLCSSPFIVRFAMVRPHLLSIALALGIAWCAVHRRRVALGALSLLYPFCYTAWHLPIILLGIVEAARLACAPRITVGNIAWSNLAVSLAGLGAGIALHPNFPTNLSFFWIQNVEVLMQVAWTGKQGFEMGPEFAGYSATEAATLLILPLSMTALAVERAATALRHKQAEVGPLAFAMMAAAFTPLTLRSSRFVEYLVPFALVAAALALRGVRLSWQLPSAIAAAVMLAASFGRGNLRYLAARGDDFPEREMAALRRAIPPRSQVITCDWGLTGGLMLALPERYFVVALDPVFFFRNDPALYEFWFDAVHRPEAKPARAFHEKMHADFVLCDARLKWRPLVAALSADPQARLRVATPLWIAFDVSP